MALLEAIRRSGSIAAAARAQGLSYRNAWGRIEKWQGVLGQSLLDSTRGSGSQLSDFALRLLEIDARLRQSVAEQLAVACADMRRAMGEAARASRVRLSITASHDLALVKLREHVAADGHQVELHFRGSLESLRTLDQGGCDVAGFHCPQGELGARIWPQYLRMLRPRKHALLRLCQRTQGLIVQRGNPKRLSSIADLARPDVRFLNRQEGAGTRLLLDSLLSRSSLDPARIHGYASEEYTHAAVAALVASGEADTGLGIEAAARRFGLDFVPLATEDYFLALNRNRLREAPFATLLAYLRSKAFREEVQALGGYESAQAGEEVPYRHTIRASAGLTEPAR